MPYKAAMAIRFALCALFSVVLLFGTRVHAYSKPNHEKLTARASELLARCAKYGVPLTAPDAAVTRILQHYNLEQDALFSKTGLWHFPEVPRVPGASCPGPFPSCLMVIERSFEPWTTYVWSRVQASLPRDQLMAALGAALHYVQDLAVPAHAIPVFHPAGLSHPSDGFDDYVGWNNPYSFPKPEEMLGECRKLEELAQTATLPELLRLVRLSTLTSLNETFSSGGVDIPFSAIWHSDAGQMRCPRDPDETRAGCVIAFDAKLALGFGRYACDGDFGEDRLQCGWHEYHMSSDDRRKYAGRRARVAIFYSAAAILLLQRFEARCPRSSCSPREGLADWYPTRSRIKTLFGSRDAR